MRAVIGLPDSQVRDLAALAARAKQPRAALERQAIAEYLARHQKTARAEAFGLWGADAPDGLAYQARIRAEW